MDKYELLTNVLMMIHRLVVENCKMKQHKRRKLQQQLSAYLQLMKTHLSELSVN